MSEFDRDDYDEKLKHLEQRHEISAAWIVVVFVALLLVSLESCLGGAQHVILHHHTFAPAVTLDPSDRIGWSDEDGDGHAVSIIGREETPQVSPGLHNTP
jgi:hypothetical protein